MLNEKIVAELKAYVAHYKAKSVSPVLEHQMSYSVSKDIQTDDLKDYIDNKRKPTLQHVLFQFIDEKDVSDAAIYKKAGIDRRHFSKIRSNQDYRPKKNTVIALALALELTVKDTEDLLSAAGYTLSDSDTNDLVIQFCLENRIFQMHHVNQALDHFNLKPLTGLH